MKRTFATALGAAFALLLLFGLGVEAQSTKDKTDESKVPQYTLPDALVMLDGTKVTDTKTWEQKRRPEIVKLFEDNVYGRAPEKPKEEMWEVTKESRDGANITKTVVIYLLGKEKKDGPTITLTITLPKTGKAVPVFVGLNSANLLARGYGTVSVKETPSEGTGGKDSWSGLRKIFGAPEQVKSNENDWGTLAVKSWVVMRAVDYLVTDRDIDSGKICVNGVSRDGKYEVWAGAQDQRIAIAFSGCSGTGGVVLVRREFGESVFAITTNYPSWFTPKFKAYGPKINDLPVDFHMLVALYAPRPFYIASATTDLHCDPKGSFLSGKHAESVYNLYGKTGIGDKDWPKAETPVGDTVGYHLRTGGHGQQPYDVTQYLAFADRHFGMSKAEKTETK